MRLYIVRHGDSLSSDIDPTQPLSKKGIQESEAVARFFTAGLSFYRRDLS